MLYAGASCCVSFKLLNAASFIFGVSATNIGDLLGGLILGGSLGSDCRIHLSTLGGGLSTLGGEMVLFGNVSSVWDIVWF